MRILIGLREIAGYYTNLQKGFMELGIPCDFICLIDHQFKYNLEIAQPIIVKVVKWLWGKRKKIQRTRFLIKMFWVALTDMSMIFLFIWALFRYDVFIFCFNSTFLYYYDLPILKLFGKKIVYVYHGSDSRPPYIDGPIMAENRYTTISECIKLTQQRKRIMQKVDKYANFIIDHPPMALFHERPFILGLCLGIPFDSKKVRKPDQSLCSSSVRILHSPSNPVIKGTAVIRSIIKRLQSKGYTIEYVELIGKPNAVVLQELTKCDFIVDQVYSDTPMAGFATEAAFFGKPSVISGYYAEFLGEDINEKYIPPSFYCHPDDLEQAIEKMITDTKFRLDLGKRAQEFVHKNWSAKVVATKYLNLINGDSFPTEWVYDPQDITYILGCGMPQKQIQKIVKSIIETGGIEALQLQDKPFLEEKLLNLVKDIKDDESNNVPWLFE